LIVTDKPDSNADRRSISVVNLKPITEYKSSNSICLVSGIVALQHIVFKDSGDDRVRCPFR